MRPELADDEHNYFKTLRSGKDEEYNNYYRKVRDEYYVRLSAENAWV